MQQIDDYFGDAGDSLEYHNGSKFSTQDNDNDGLTFTNCAQYASGKINLQMMLCTLCIIMIYCS